VAKRDNFPDKDSFFPSLEMANMLQLLIVSFDCLRHCAALFRDRSNKINSCYFLSTTLLPNMKPISPAARGWFWFMPLPPKALPGVTLWA
jgi:hypothetical protein